MTNIHLQRTTKSSILTLHLEQLFLFEGRRYVIINTHKPSYAAQSDISAPSGEMMN